jgi:hypothetical protein
VALQSHNTTLTHRASGDCDLDCLAALGAGNGNLSQTIVPIASRIWPTPAYSQS